MVDHLMTDWLKNGVPWNGCGIYGLDTREKVQIDFFPGLEAPGVDATKQPKKGRGIGSMEKWETYPESRNTEDLQEGLRAKACTDDPKDNGWMDNPQNCIHQGESWYVSVMFTPQGIDDPLV